MNSAGLDGWIGKNQNDKRVLDVALCLTFFPVSCCCPCTDGMVADYLYHEGILDENLNRENAESFAKYKDKMDFLKVSSSSSSKYVLF